MARKKIVAGNWKMNMTPSEAVKLVETLKPLVKNEEVDVVFCVPAIDIIPVVEAAKGTNIQIGAENMYFEEKGAYTGEISPNMLTDAGVKYVVLGHSERREYFAETNETVNKKMLKAFEHGITPIMCCGETLEQREQGVTMDFIRQQVKVGFMNVTADQAKEAVIAYEPIWSIGPGKTPADKAYITKIARFVKEKTGVDNVCERAAMKAANEEGTFILRKQAENGMTIAIVKYDWKLERELAKEYRIDEQ